jgi:anaphase-promoting complex subunit 8
MTAARHPHAPQLQAQPEDIRIMELDLEWQDGDILTTARTCIEAREFLRAAHLLRDCKSSKALFLNIYSHFIVSKIVWFTPRACLIMNDRPVKRKASEIGTNLTVGYGFNFLEFSWSDLFSDNRHQPPIPVNSALHDLLNMVRNTTDPWLLFLYVASIFTNVLKF